MRVAVAGAGLAGLACAVDLARAGLDVTVFEARERTGGRAWSGAMADGAIFERGGEFVETGYDHFLRRAGEYGLALTEQGFEFAAREVRSGRQSFPALLLEARRALASTVDALGAQAARTSAAQALASTPLEPLARQALTRRLEGTYSVELDRVSASWLRSDELRAGEAARHRPSSRLAAGNDALARALAAELGDRIRLGRAIHSLQGVETGVALVTHGTREQYDRAVLAVPLPVALDLLPALRERASYARLQWGVAAKLHVPLTGPVAAAAVQGLAAAFWTWTASGTRGAPGTVAASFAGGIHAAETLGIRHGSERWCQALHELRPELALATDGAVLTNWSTEPHIGGAYACHPPGWSRRDDEEVAAPYGCIHLAGEHTAAEFCGTLEGALRSGARTAAEVLAEARASS
jgi:monoamine oxidase